MTPPREHPDNDALARHRYITIKHTIPDRLEWIAGQLTDCLDLVARYGLDEALQPHPGRYDVAPGLRDATRRLRVAAANMPPVADCPEPERLLSHGSSNNDPVGQALRDGAGP